jgi:hypothetical protein
MSVGVKVEVLQQPWRDYIARPSAPSRSEGAD